MGTPRQLLWWRERAKRVRLEVIKRYGGKCACCGESTIEFLSIDHVRGGGRKHRRELGATNYGGTRYYMWIIKNNFPDGLRVLCYNCDMARGFSGYCPHEGERLASSNENNT